MPDASIVFLGNIDLLWLILALAGGAFGAMIGANNAFAFTGVSILVGLGILAGTGNGIVLDYVAFGPVFGPHIAFAGGVGAAAYAGSRGILAGGMKNVNDPLAGLGKPDVLLVGALFGVAGYVVERLVQLIPWFGSNTDTVAVTVVLSGIAARLIFGKTGVFANPGLPPAEGKRWLEWQEQPGQLLAISAFAGLLASGIAMIIGSYILPLSVADDTWARMIDNAHVFPFAISAITIFFVAAGVKMPVTHHITITAALAAVTFLAISGSGLVGLLAGLVFGVIAGFLGEFMARLMYSNGDTHIDPPAAAIWVMNTLIALVAMPFA